MNNAVSHKHWFAVPARANGAIYGTIRCDLGIEECSQLHVILTTRPSPFFVVPGSSRRVPSWGCPGASSGRGPHLTLAPAERVREGTEAVAQQSCCSSGTWRVHEAVRCEGQPAGTTIEVRWLPPRAFMVETSTVAV